MNKILLNKYIRYGLFIVAGIVIGRVLFYPAHPSAEKTGATIEKPKETIWTCAMHPQIRRNAPGPCPICGMELIPLSQYSGSDDPSAIHLTKDAAQLANVLTSVVSRQNPVKEVRLYGKVQADERLLQSQVVHIPGRIEKLMVNFTGEAIRKGQTLASIYSPEMITAQQELLEAAKMKEAQPGIYEAAKEKLHEWMLTEAQIDAIEKAGVVKTTFDITSNTQGIVTARRVNNGDYVTEGAVLFEIADLSHVWVLFEAYESDLPFLKTGDQLTFNLQALPGIDFSERILFIDPVIDPVTRVTRVRIEIANKEGRLKPEMFATGIIKAQLNEYRNNLVIPRSAVLWTGKRSIVYVKLAGSNEPVFKMREVGLGPMLGNSYVITDGLKEGEEIVTQGTFNVDAAAQLEGKPSMMNQESKKTTLGDTHENTTIPNGMKGSPDAASLAKMIIPEKSLSKNELTFGVAGNCDLCKARIEKAAKSVSGVSTATWDAQTKKIHVVYNGKADLSNEIQQAIADAGHDTEGIKASEKVYKTLPGCCRYR